MRTGRLATTDIDWICIQEVLKSTERLIIHLMLLNAPLLDVAIRAEPMLFRVALRAGLFSPLVPHLLSEHLPLQLVLVHLLMVLVAGKRSLFLAVPVYLLRLSMTLECSMIRFSMALELLASVVLH